MKKNIIILTLFFITTFTFAQWQRTNGPYGTTVNCFAVNGNTLFAGGSGGVFQTSNQGTTWNYISSSFTPYPYEGGENVMDMLIDGNNLFAGTSTGLFISTNNGTTWSLSNTGLLNTYVMKLFKFGNDLYAGTSTEVYKSTNNGASWNSSSIGIPSSAILSFASINNNIFVGTSIGTYISSNNGLTWSPIYFTTGSSLPAYLGSSGTNLFAGTSNGVFKSTNNGTTWTNINSNLSTLTTNTVTGANCLSVVGGTIFVGKSTGSGNSFGGLYKSNNNGLSWTDSNTGIFGRFLSYKYIVSAFGSNLICGSLLGMHISNDGGNTWKSFGLGHANRAAYLKHNGQDLYCGTDNGLFVTSNGGVSWNSINNGLPSNAGVSSVCFNGTTLFASIPGGQPDIPSSGVYISNNNGANWTSSNTGLTNLKVNYVAAYGGTVFAGTSTGLFISTNNGGNWSPSNTGLPVNTQINKIHYNFPVLFISTNQGIYISTNNGINWTLSGGSIIATCFENDGSIVYAATSAGAYKSTNYGTSWTQLNSGVSAPNLTSIINLGGFLLAGDISAGPRISFNGAVSWSSTWDINLQNNYSKALSTNAVDVFYGTGQSSSYEDINAVWRRGAFTFTGIKNYDISKNIKLYPNPANNFLNILIDGEVIESASIIDLLGKELIYNLNTNIIDISGLLSGSYTLKIILKGKVNPYYTKFIKLN
jgi:ligand-binding sensor domain-containing protein